MNARIFLRGSRRFASWALAVVATAACGIGTQPRCETADRPLPSPPAPQGPAQFWPGPLAARTPPTAPSTWHVSPNGSGKTCTQQAPCLDIARALAHAKPGDLVLVEEGEYDHFTIEDIHGSEGRPITLFATGKGAFIRPEPGCFANQSKCRDNVLIVESSHLVIDGLRSCDAPRASLAILFSHHVTVRNSVFGPNGRWGIFTAFTDDLVLEHNETFGSRKEHGIYVSNSSDRVVVRGNLIHDNVAGGLQINADFNIKDPEGLYSGKVDGITSDSLIEGNVVYRNGRKGGGAINLDGVQDSIVRNNLLFDNMSTGIVLYGDRDGIEDDDDDDGWGRFGPKGMVVDQNTVIMPLRSRHALQIRFAVGPNQVRNNVLLHHNQEKAGLEIAEASDLPHTDSDFNVVERISLDGTLFTLAQWQRRHQRELNSSAARASSWAVTPMVSPLPTSGTEGGPIGVVR